MWLKDFYVLHVLITTGIFIIAAMSLNLLLGYTGQLSLGHVAFFGIGAYVSSLVSLGFEINVAGIPIGITPKPVWFAMLWAVVVAGLFGWIIGRISFKVRGAYFVIVTVSFAEVVRLVALNWVELTQGPMALNNIPHLQLGDPATGWVVSFLRKPQSYYLMLVFAIVTYIVIARLVDSRAGRAMIALRENEPLATSVGIDVTRYLVLATAVSAGIAGAAGALYAHYIRIVDPDVFLFIYTVTMVIMVITGGKGTLAGPIVGGALFGLFPEVLRSMSVQPEVQWIVYGILMILVVYFLPEGIVPAVSRWWRSYFASSPPDIGVAAPAGEGMETRRGRS
ncbi:MAG: branched-chain amino acid ABC transporter permease [Rhizobiales bacterium]|nr:branched-chain amino acid ABC transporter permease [Hyphomicrobiales bacterium]